VFVKGQKELKFRSCRFKAVRQLLQRNAAAGIQNFHWFHRPVREHADGLGLSFQRNLTRISKKYAKKLKARNRKKNDTEKTGMEKRRKEERLCKQKASTAGVRGFLHTDAPDGRKMQGYEHTHNVVCVSNVHVLSMSDYYLEEIRIH
jgi:hypothetical protein